MQEHTINVGDSTHTEINPGELTRFIMKGTCYAVYGLFVVVDGVNNPASFDSRLLTIPYFVAGLALARSFCESLDQHYEGHAAIFALGLSTLGALT